MGEAARSLSSEVTKWPPWLHEAEQMAVEPLPQPEETRARVAPRLAVGPRLLMVGMALPELGGLLKFRRRKGCI